MQRNLDTHFYYPPTWEENQAWSVGLWDNMQVVKDNVLNIVPQSWGTVGASHDVEKPPRRGGLLF